MRRISEEKVKGYQSQGYWKGLTFDQCRRFEDEGYWPGITLSQYLDEAAKTFPGNEAIVYNNERITFQDFNNAVNNLASNLLKLGIKKGDVICVQLPNCPEMAYLQVALPKIGAIIEPIHLVYRSYEVKKRLEFCEAKAYVYPADSAGFDFHQLGTDMKKNVSHLEHIFMVANDDSVPGNTINLRSLCDEGSHNGLLDDYLKDFEEDPNDILFINFTSGTETDPKGFLHTHNTLLGISNIICTKICNFNKGDEIFLSFSPMTHSFGLFITALGIQSCGKVIMVDTFSPTQTLSLVEKEGITFMQGTPTHLSRFLNHKDFSKHDLKSVRLYATGGAAISPSLIEQFNRQLPSCKLTNWFGMGEDGIHTLNSPDDPFEYFLDTVGAALPNGSELGIFDEKGTSVPNGVVGEIAYRGPNMFLGYYKNPEKTENTRTHDGWFLTGDTGFIDENGRLRLYGRKKDVISRGGSKVFPLTIENILCFHPKVGSVAVIGLPDADLGEKVCACIIPRPGEEMTQDDIFTYLAEKGASKYESPDVVVFCDAFPMTPTGKVKKDLLQKESIGKNLGAS